MTIAIQNETGVVYRVLTSWGMGPYISVTQELLQLGLKDIYADNMNPPDYDSLFIFANTVTARPYTLRLSSE